MSVRKNADGSITVGCIEDTIKPNKEPKPTPKATKAKTPKAKNAPKEKAQEVLADEEVIIIE